MEDQTRVVFPIAEKWAPLDIQFPQRDPPARKNIGGGGGDRKSSVRGGGDRDRDRNAAEQPNRHPKHSSESSRNWREDARGTILLNYA